MTSPDPYLLCGSPTPGDFTLFRNVIPISTDPIEIRGFAVYALVDRLDDPDHPFYSVLAVSPTKTATVLPCRFSEPLPDFTAIGLQATRVPQGIALHISPETLSILDSQGRIVRLKDGDWIRNAQKYHAVGALRALGIVEELSPSLFSLKEYLPVLTRKFHQVYGTYGDLCDALRLTFERIKFACRVFAIGEAIAIIDRNLDQRDVYFTPLLPALTNSCELRAAKRQFCLTGEVDSPFLVLLNYLRLVFEALRPECENIDDQDGFFAALHVVQRRNGLPIGNCDRSTVETLISAAQLKPVLPFPIFAMANIQLRTYRETHFPPLPPITDEQPEKLAEDVRKVINHAVSALPNPKAKVEWMNGQIRREVGKVGDDCTAFRKRMAGLEAAIDSLSARLRSVMMESTAALDQIQIAEQTLNVVAQEHQRVQEKYKALKLELQREQRYTRSVVILGIVLTFLGVLRVFWLR
jgi:hypothetical protein